MLEVKISELIMENFYRKLKSNLSVDIAIVGAGPSGLLLSYLLARQGKKVVVFEAKNAPGGGIWGGGMLFNEIVVQKDLTHVLDELEIDYKIYNELVTIDSVHFASALIYKATKNGVVIFNNIYVEDIVLINKRVKGVVINWSPVIKNQMHVDPITVYADFVTDSTGHPAFVVDLLAKRGIIQRNVEFPMDAEIAEDFVAKATGEVFDGLVVTGMAATAVKGGPRMGPIFGGMLKSAIRASEYILEKLGD